MTKYFLGVDGGGTKTRAVLIDARGAVRGVGEAGPGNWQAVGAGAAGTAIREAVLQALVLVPTDGSLTDGVAEARAVVGSFFGLAGVRTAEENAIMAAEIAKLGLGGTVEIGGDLVVAHAGALAGRPGVVVIAGTGSAAWGRNGYGVSAQAGGWGWLVDDKGGGYWLALRGLAAAVEALDGRGPATRLGDRASEYFGVAGLRELLRELHTGARDRAAVAGFAAEVRALAAEGDLAARALVEEAGEELLRLAKALRAPLVGDDATEAFPLAVTGGLGMGAVIAEAAERGGFTPVEPWGDPVLGAVLLAARAGGVELDAAARSRLLKEWKPRD